MRTFLALLALLAPIAAQALPACQQVCSTQTFTTNPFDTSQGTPRWTAFNEGTACPITWDETNKRMQRTSPSATACDHTTAYVRYNGSIAGDQCAIFRIHDNTDGAGNAVWEIGWVLRSQSDQDSQLFPNGPLYEVVRCEEGAACNFLRWESNSIFGDFVNGEYNDFGSATGPGAILTGASGGDYLGICRRGIGRSGTVINAYRWAVDPGAPTDQDNWGTPAATVRFEVGGYGSMCGGDKWCDSYGNMLGVWFRANDVGAGGKISFDDFKVYSCQ